MIKKVTVVNPANEKLTIELTNPWRTGLAITRIEGVGPPQANINATEFATADGGVYNSARTQTRNIVITMKLLENPTIEDSRQLTYKFFPIKKKVTIFFETENRDVYVEGYVESNEQDIFTNLTACQISIICPFPYFTSTKLQETLFYGVEPVFEFPVDITAQSLEFGNIYKKQERNVYYDGEVETGVVMYLRATGNVKNVSLYNLGTRETMKIDTDMLETMTGSGFKAGDLITISTMSGQKAMILLRDGVEKNIINCLGKNTDWLVLRKGDNQFAFSVEEGLSNLAFSINSRIVYEGI